jgi:hypothetical protein
VAISRVLVSLTEDSWPGGTPRLLLPFGEPGDLQFQVPLQLPSGGRTDGAGFEEPGQFGVLSSDEIALVASPATITAVTPET